MLCSKMWRRVAKVILRAVTGSVFVKEAKLHLNSEGEEHKVSLPFSYFLQFVQIIH